MHAEIIITLGLDVAFFIVFLGTLMLAWPKAWALVLPNFTMSAQEFMAKKEIKAEVIQHEKIKWNKKCIFD